MRTHFRFLILLSLAANINLIAQWNDSIKVYWLDPVEITSEKLSLGDYQTPVEKDNLSSILNRNGFNLIRKGVFFAQDIYADGFKKGDISIVVDGERYHCACPNRMDSPLSRVNPLELKSIELSKTAGNIQSGLGGKVSFHRTAPIEPISVKAGFSGSSESLQSIDGSISAEGYNHRLSLRYSTGLPYKDADDRSFKDLYSYKDNFSYNLAEAIFQGNESLWKYGAAFTFTENVSFPYLLMDEISNKVFSAYVSYDNNKVYFNYTDHLMTNQLRVSTGSMVSDARNLTIGAIGNFYEFYFRNWNIDNVISTPMMTINNDMMPDIKMYSATLFKKLGWGKFDFSGRVGFVHHNIGNENRMDFYKTLFPDAESSRWFPTFGLSANYSAMVTNNWGLAGLIEVASEAPETEYMFIAVSKPTVKANWSGNPTLKQPIRSTLRSSINYTYLSLELFGTRVWNYINLKKDAVGTKPYTTYENINAYMLGMNIRLNWNFIELNAGYTYAHNTTNETPLSEIPPLSISTKLISPVFFNVIAYIRHQYNNAQLRVDESLKESTSSAWNRFDIGVEFKSGSFLVSLVAENITNVLYYQHLSYLRDPFASGNRVFEPGRTIKLNVRFSSFIN